MTAALLSAIPSLAQTPTTTAQGVEQPSKPAQVGIAVVQGCFSSPGELVSIGNVDFNSRDKCAVDNCKAQGYAVAASMGGAECFCGNKYPPKAALTNDSNCNAICPGWGADACECDFVVARDVKQDTNPLLQAAAASSGQSTTPA
jgi:cell wall integrity and stress response component